MSSSSIYDLHRAAFARVSAYVIVNHAGDRVATIAFKFPADGAGRLWAYVHYIGAPMVRGYAGGFGYDKRSAACAAAALKLDAGVAPEFVAALAKDDGHDWDYQLRQAGYTVMQAV